MPFFNGKRHHELDSGVQRQLGDCERCPRMRSPFAEDSNEQVRGSVEDIWLVSEIWSRCNVAVDSKKTSRKPPI